MLREADLMWLAGLLEGEGCFGGKDGLLRGQRHIDIHVTLRMTDLDVVSRAAKLMGRVSRTSQKRPNVNWKQIYQVKCSGYAAARLMEELLPHMGERRTKKITEVLDLWNSRPVKKREAHLHADCHPDRKNVAGGLCRPCYKKIYDATRRAPKADFSQKEIAA